MVFGRGELVILLPFEGASQEHALRMSVTDEVSRVLLALLHQVWLSKLMALGCGYSKYQDAHGAWLWLHTVHIEMDEYTAAPI